MAMKKFINDPDHLVNELLAATNKVALTGNIGCAPNPQTRWLVVGGGHEPALSGFGARACSISAFREIFAAPGPRVFEALNWPTATRGRWSS